MNLLKSKFIQKEVQQQSTSLRTKNTELRGRPMPKSFKDYAIFCIKTNNVQALVKGYMSVLKIWLQSYTRYILRCHYCRKKKPGQAKIIYEETQTDKMRKLRYNNKNSNLPPIWWQNSRVSYSYFASGSSSFLDFSIKKDQQIKKKDSNIDGSNSPDELKTKTGLNSQI